MSVKSSDNKSDESDQQSEYFHKFHENKYLMEEE